MAAVLSPANFFENLAFWSLNMSEKKESCRFILAHSCQWYSFPGLPQWAKPEISGIGFLTRPPEVGGRRDSWNHWRRITSKTTLMPHFPISSPSLNSQRSPMDQKVSVYNYNMRGRVSYSLYYSVRSTWHLVQEILESLQHTADKGSNGSQCCGHHYVNTRVKEQ